MVFVKSCLLMVALSGIAVSAERAAALCTSADTPATCLFKGLLKIVLGYSMSRNNDAAGTEQITGNHQLQQLQQSKGIEAYLVQQIQNIIGLFSLGLDLPTEVVAPWSLLKSSIFNGRGKKNKNLGPMLAAGVAMMTGTLMPIAFGTLFMLAGKAIMTSLMAITISGLLGLKSLFGNHESGGSRIKTYAPAPSSHYAEAQFEQESVVHKGQTEGKMQNSAANYYTGDSSLSAYYDHNRGDQLNNGSDQPEYYVTGGGGGSVNRVKFSRDDENNKIIVEKNDIL